VEFEQKGEQRVAYEEGLLRRLSSDLILRYGRGFSRQNFQQMRQFYLLYPSKQICPTPSGILHAASIELSSGDLAGSFRAALVRLPNKVMAAKYRTALPAEKELAAEIKRTHEVFEGRKRFLLPLHRKATSAVKGKK
jgi:hypothetical protein